MPDTGHQKPLILKERLSTGGKIGLALMAFLIAALAAAVSLGSIAKARAPQLALQIQPQNGFAYSNLARRGIEVNSATADGFLKLSDPLRIESLSTRALASEPTDARALTNLALAVAEEDGSRAQQLHALSLRLSRREMLSQLITVERYANEGDFTSALLHVGQVLQVRPETRSTLMPYLVQLAQYDEALPAIAAMLKQRPDLRDGFWKAAVEVDGETANLVKLRSEFGSADDFRQSRNDEFLLQALVNQGRLEDAAELAARIFPSFSDVAPGTLRNSDFSKVPAIRPFDWRLFSSGSFSTDLDPDQGILAVSVSRGMGGVAASQLVALPNGRYSIKADFLDSQIASAQDASLRVEIRCANTSAGAPEVSVDAEGLTRGTMFTLSQGCSYRYVNIVVSGQDEFGTVDYLLDGLSLTRLGA